MLADIKLLLGITDNSEDDLLNLLITIASTDAKIMAGVSDITAIQSVVEKMVVYLYNRRGTEGLSQESYSGATYHYENNYPESITSVLDDYKNNQGNALYLETY